MFPELFKIPFTELTIKSYGTMLVVALLFSLWLIKKMCKRVGYDSEILTNATMYALIAGVIGARVMYVLHYKVYEQGFFEIFAVWKGGLELLGGVIFAIGFLLFYLKRKKCDMLTNLDILSVVLLGGIAIGRIGCFLNGCCYGHITDAPTGVIFPYDSIVYNSQAYPDPDRDRDKPYLDLPAKFYGYSTDAGWVSAQDVNKLRYPLKPRKLLSDAEKKLVSKDGPYHALPVHPTQLYSTVVHGFNCAMLCMFWYRFGSGTKREKKYKGCTFSIMFIMYSVFRFLIEFVRDDNPYEIFTLTISQIISLAMFTLGILGLLYYSRRRS